MNKRISYWDNLKFLLILFVVMGHFIDPHTETNNYAKQIFLFIYCFHMPLFLFVSGVFYNSRNLRSKILFLVCTGFLLKILNLISNTLLRDMAPKISLLRDTSTPWYLFALAVFMLLRYLIRDKNKWFFLGFSVLMGCVSGYDSSVGDYLYLSRIIVFFPFYLAGSMVDRNQFTERIKCNYTAYLGAVSVLLLLFYFCHYRLGEVYIYRHLLTGRNPFTERIISYGFMARLGCYVVSTCVGLSFMILTPQKHLPLISEWGSNTLNVLFWHKFFFYALTRYTPFFDWYDQGFRGQFAYMLVAVVLTVIISAFKCFSFPLEYVRRQCFAAVPDRQ